MQKMKNKIPIRHACADPDNSARGGGGGGGGGGGVPVFLLGNKWQLMIFMGRSGPPAPSVSAHIRVSNSLDSHFILFFCWAWSIHMGAQWLSGRVLDSRLKGHGFEPQRRHCVVVLEQDTFILALYWFNPGRPIPV